MILQSTCSYIAGNEGTRYTMYHDSLGILTIGNGFNLQRQDADKLLKQFGSSLASVMAGDSLTEDQVYKLLGVTVNEAISNCVKLFPEFYSLTDNQQMALTDMSFNLGLHRLSGFTHMIAAVNNNNFQEASSQMLGSHWAQQVGKRAQKDAELIQQ